MRIEDYLRAASARVEAVRVVSSGNRGKFPGRLFDDAPLFDFMVP